LVIPGFITGVAGALLLLPPVQRWCGTRIIRALGAAPTRPAERAVVDLAPDQWHQVGNERPDGRP
jgi:UPF0716 family protein affecting phage T7 exclusion